MLTRSYWNETEWLECSECGEYRPRAQMNISFSHEDLCDDCLEKIIQQKEIEDAKP